MNYDMRGNFIFSHESVGPLKKIPYPFLPRMGIFNHIIFKLLIF
jgi:hypothetical protein